MKKKISSSIATLLAIMLLVGLFPATLSVVSAADTFEITDISHDDIISWDVDDDEITLTVPYDYEGSTLDLSTLSFTTSFALSSIYRSESTATIDGPAVQLELTFRLDGAPEDIDAQYSVSVVREAAVDAAFTGTISKTFYSVGTSALSAADFTGKYTENDGKALSYIKITGSNSSFGSLKLDGSTYAFDTEISLEDLDKLTFVSTRSGSVSYTVEAFDEDDTKAEGTVTLSISVSPSTDISYETDKGEEIVFDVDDFIDACDDATGGTLSYVKFTSLPTSSEGVLYYNYSSSSSSKVSSNTKYYSNSSSYIKYVSFVPKSSFTGTVYIDYTGWDKDGNDFDGEIEITVNSSSSSNTITYSTNKGKALTFKLSDFTDACDDATDGTLDFVEFDLPSSTAGTLYYDYDSSSSYDFKVSSSDEFYRNENPYIKYVSFVPKSSYTGTVTFSYTGYDTDGYSFDGKVKITVRSSTSDSDSDDIEYTVYQDEYITFDVDDFIDACDDATGETLDYVRFTLPSSSYGTLYYDYTSYSSYDSTVSSSTKYYRNYSKYIEDVSFVPNMNYTGTFTISYTGYDDEGDSFSGKIKITVKEDTDYTNPGGNTSKYFYDVGSDFYWAQPSIDYLYEKGIVVGTSSATFSPSTSIKRGDFCLMLYRAFDFDDSTVSGSFNDVAYGTYYYDAITSMKGLGIAVGFENMFRPEDLLTREEAFTLIYRALEAAGEAPSTGSVDDLSAFTDTIEISSYAISSTGSLVRSGIVKGDGGKIYPKRNVTRAEMAALLYRIITN